MYGRYLLCESEDWEGQCRMGVSSWILFPLQHLPGGPKSKTPLTASAATPSRYNLGYLRGYVTH